MPSFPWPGSYPEIEIPTAQIPGGKVLQTEFNKLKESTIA
jgi:hypothetical protein